jgi:hypothetical protein
MKQAMCILIIPGLLALAALPAYAADSSERGTSIYDKHPECMDRSAAAKNPSCTIQNGPPHRHVVGATAGAATGTGSGAAQTSTGSMGTQASGGTGAKGGMAGH